MVTCKNCGSIAYYDRVGNVVCRRCDDPKGRNLKKNLWKDEVSEAV